MARGMQTPKHLLKATTLLGVLILLSGITVFLATKHSNPIAKLPPFPLQSYMDGGNLWSHEDYSLQGKVENVFLRSDDRTKYLAAIRPEGSELLVPVLFESDTAGATPVQREQALLLEVHLGPSGEILCTAHD